MASRACHDDDDDANVLDRLDGYDEDRFENKVDRKLQCPICLKVLNDPMQCPNEHYFCNFCIRTHIEKTSKTCPLCQHHLTEEMLAKAPRIVMEFLWSLKIRCNYAKRGCAVMVELQFLANHVKDCEYVPTPCTNPGCSELVNKGEKKKHEDELCRFRPVLLCDECGQEVSQTLSQFHPCMMKKAMDGLAASIATLRSDMTGLKSTHEEFMTEVRNMMVGIKAASEDAVQELERKVSNMLAEVKLTTNQHAVKKLHRKVRDEMGTKQTGLEKEMACLSLKDPTSVSGPFSFTGSFGNAAVKPPFSLGQDREQPTMFNIGASQTPTSTVTKKAVAKPQFSLGQEPEQPTMFNIEASQTLATTRVIKKAVRRTRPR